jgi:hypothetical protein
MPGSATAEIIFIASMMALILIVCIATVFFFFRTFRNEKRSREAEKNNADIPNPKSKIF